MRLLGRTKKSAGLDIGSGFVKLVVIDHTKAEPEIVGIAISPMVPDAIVEGEVMDPALVADTIRSVSETAGLKRAATMAAVGGHDVIIKTIETDRIDEKAAQELIRWEAQQHVPFDMDSVELDFQILDPDGSDPTMPVLLVAAKQELIETRLALLSEAGLKPAVLDVEAFALHNAFERNYEHARSGLVALVNVGYQATNVNLMEDGHPVLVRDVPFGSRRLREALQRERGLTASQAEAVIQGKGETADLPAFVSQRVEELAVAIERVSAFVLTQSNAAAIGRVFVCGGGARVPGLVNALGTRLGVRTDIANPLERIRVHPEVMQAVPVDEVAPMLMLAVGLALRRT